MRTRVLLGCVVVVFGLALPVLSEDAAQVLWSVSSFGDNDFFDEPSDIEVDRARSLIYVVDAGSCRVLVFDPGGKFVRAIGRKGQGPGEFATPTGLCLTGDGGIAVADRDNGRIQLVGPNGSLVRSVKVTKTRVADLVIANGRFFTVAAHGVSTYNVTMGSRNPTISPWSPSWTIRARWSRRSRSPTFPRSRRSSGPSSTASAWRYRRTGGCSCPSSP